MADVFLSYKREDQQIAREVVADLEAEGFSVFFDVRIEVGDSWDATIERELIAAKAVVVLWSANSRGSQWVRREAREAEGRLAPAFISDCKPPLEFSDLQGANLINRRLADRQHPEWRRLCDRVSSLIGRASVSHRASEFEIDRKALFQSQLFLSEIALDPTASWLAVTVGETSEDISVWDLRTGCSKVNLNNGLVPHCVSFTRDGSRLLAGYATPDLLPQPSEDCVVVVWDIGRKQQILTLRGHTYAVVDASTNERESLILTASWDGTARLWLAQSGDEYAVLSGHTAPVRTARFSPDEAYVVTASSDATVLLWHIPSRKQVALLEHKWDVRSAVFSPDGHSIATASRDGVRIWNAASRTLAFSLPHEGAKRAFFSRTGQRLVTASEHDVRIWDVSSRRQVHPSPISVEKGGSISLSANGRKIGIIASNGAEVWTLSQPLA